MERIEIFGNYVDQSWNTTKGHMLPQKFGMRLQSDETH